MNRPRSNQSSFVLLISGLCCTAFLSGCSSRSIPAPVVEVYQGKTYLEHKKADYDGKNYTVKKGDTLFAIAWFAGRDYRDIARLNNISKPYSIYPGQQLSLNFQPTPKPKRSTKLPGQTSKTKANQTVDPPKKQAYGDSKDVAGNKLKPSSINQFPSRVERWVWPAKGKLTSSFSLKELGNKGIDITGRRGDDIFAAADGKVVYTGNALRGFGNLVIIKHTETFLSAYAHNDKIFVKEQEWITAGQKIASMGNSDADAVMLHFEVRYKGKSVDPMRYLPKQQ